MTQSFSLALEHFHAAYDLEVDRVMASEEAAILKKRDDTGGKDAMDTNNQQPEAEVGHKASTSTAEGLDSGGALPNDEISLEERPPAPPKSVLENTLILTSAVQLSYLYLYGLGGVEPNSTIAAAYLEYPLEAGNAAGMNLAATILEFWRRGGDEKTTPITSITTPSPFHAAGTVWSLFKALEKCVGGERAAIAIMPMPPMQQSPPTLLQEVDLVVSPAATGAQQFQAAEVLTGIPGPESLLQPTIPQPALVSKTLFLQALSSGHTESAFYLGLMSLKVRARARVCVCVCE